MACARPRWVIHLRAAVGAVEQAGQRIGLPGGVRAVDGFSDLLGQFPSLRVHNGLMGMLENRPFLRGPLDGVFVFIGFLVRAEVDGMSHVLRLGEDIRDRRAAPVVGAAIIVAVPLRPLSPLTHID